MVMKYLTILIFQSFMENISKLLEKKEHIKTEYSI